MTNARPTVQRLTEQVAELVAANEVLKLEIAARQLVEDDLRLRDRQSRELLDNIPVLVSLLAPNGDVQLVSRRTLEYTGKTREELAAWGMTDLIHSDDRLAAIESFRNGLASNQQHEIVFRMRRADGVYRWFQAVQTPLADASGSVASWCVAVNDIDDRKRAEDATAASELRSRSAIDGIPGLVATLGTDGTVEFVNRQIAEYTGSSIQELREWGTNGIVHPADMPHVAEVFLGAIATGTPYLIEQRIRRFDGTYRWFDNRGLPILDGSGRVTGWYVLMADIDDRRRAQDALRASEHHLRSLVDGLPGFVATLGRNGDVESANRRLLEYVNVPFDELQQWGTNGIVHPDDLQHVGSAFSASMATGEPYDYEHRLRGADGTYRWFSDRGIPVLDDSGRVASWYVLISDIDDRKQAEAELRRAYDSFSDAQHLSHTGSFITDLVGDDHNWSDETYRIFEFELNSEVSLERIQNLIHPDDLPSFGAMIARAMEGANVDFGFRIVTPRGSTKHIRGLAHVVETVAGRPMFVGALQDVTERVLAEEALDRTRADLAHVARVSALSTLTASIAHEISQPLSGIVTNASTSLRMLAADPPDVAGAQETARRTIRDGRRASDVIARLRALFSNRPYTAEAIDLNEAARGVVALSSSELLKNRIELVVDLAAELPPVTGDRVQLQQVVLNLLLNASDAMIGVEGRPRRIIVKTVEGDDEVQLTVEDTGIGIDPERASRLFDAFYTTKDKGMGIGLSVSRSIIEHHHGRIWASRTSGHGACFSFALPRGP